MKLSSLSRDELAGRLGGAGLFLHTGPFVCRLRTRIPAVLDGLQLLYANHHVAAHESFSDFHIALVQPANLRRWYRPQVHFRFDGAAPFKPLPLNQALPFFEWSLNWSIAFHAHQYVILHAATLERNGQAAILPGPPGSGKSTLTAYLVHNGWRLLSDELTMISPQSGLVTALARPVSLKNASIDIVRQMIPAAEISKASEDTAKGTVALLKAPADSVARADEPARPAWVIFPRFKHGAATLLKPRSKADTLIELGQNAFNYSIHGRSGFETLANIVEGCGCYDFSYSDLAEARELFAELASTDAPEVSA